MEDNLGIVTWQVGMDALEQVHMNCPWSAVYDMTNRAIYLAVFNNYDDITWVNLEDFNFIMVDIPEINANRPEELKISSFPNPFSEDITIHYILPAKSRVELNLYDLTGKKVITLIDEEIEAGEQTVPWNGRDSEGQEVSPGLFIGLLKYNNQFTVFRLVKTGTSF
jgi:hypothetical protein